MMRDRSQLSDALARHRAIILEMSTAQAPVNLPPDSLEATVLLALKLLTTEDDSPAMACARETIKRAEKVWHIVE